MVALLYKPGWVFIHLPMNEDTGRTDRCTIDRIENDRVIWYVGDGADKLRDWYSTPLFKFAHAVKRGAYFAAPPVRPDHDRIAT
jgi:hypothetical protein